MTRTLHGDGEFYSDIDLGLPAWWADNPLWDCPGVGPCQPFLKWDMNADDGPNKNDLQAIILAGITKGFGSPVSDPRRIFGQNEGGANAGSFCIELPGTLGAWTYAETSAPWGASTYDETGFSTTDGNSAIGNRTATFEVVPEPSTIVLLATGALVGLMSARRKPRLRPRRESPVR